MRTNLKREFVFVCERNLESAEEKKRFERDRESLECACKRVKKKKKKKEKKKKKKEAGILVLAVALRVVNGLGQTGPAYFYLAYGHNGLLTS